MKKLIALSFVLCLTAVANAASYTPVVLLSGTLTNNTALSNATMVAQTAIIDCQHQQILPIAISYGCQESEKHTNYLYFISSVDRVNWDTEQTPIILELGNSDDPAAGDARCMITNINVANYGWLKLTYTTNHSNAEFTFTNYVITYGRKVL